MVIITDRQIEAITDSLRPLQPSEQTPFKAALLEVLLASREQIGDGELGRALRELQRRYFRPPSSTDLGAGEVRIAGERRRVTTGG